MPELLLSDWRRSLPDCLSVERCAHPPCSRAALAAKEKEREQKQGLLQEEAPKRGRPPKKKAEKKVGLQHSCPDRFAHACFQVCSSWFALPLRAVSCSAACFPSRFMWVAVLVCRTRARSSARRAATSATTRTTPRARTFTSDCVFRSAFYRVGAPRCAVWSPLCVLERLVQSLFELCVLLPLCASVLMLVRSAACTRARAATRLRSCTCAPTSRSTASAPTPWPRFVSLALRFLAPVAPFACVLACRIRLVLLAPPVDLEDSCVRAPCRNCCCPSHVVLCRFVVARRTSGSATR